MRRMLFALLFGAIIFTGCSTINEAEAFSDLNWLNVLTEKMQNEPVGNPPQSVWKYDYKSATVFYVPPQCCDQFSVLYSADGVVLGFPDGGITGTGDGRFPDFFTVRTNEFLVWKDSRTR